MTKSFRNYIFIIIALISIISVNAQDESADEQDNDKSAFKFNSYFGIDFNYTDALDINPFLSESGVPTVRRFPIGFVLGFTTSFYENRIDLDFGFYNQEREQDNLGHKLNGFNIGLRYLRQVHQFKKGNSIAIGASVTYFRSELEFYDKSESIDLDDPGSFGDVAKLKNGQLYLGPTLSYSISSKKEDGEYVRFQLTYDFNVTQNDWSSDYARVDNSINETGNRFRLQVMFPF